MKLSRYLKDRWALIVVSALALMFVAAVLYIYSLAIGVIVFIEIVLLLALSCCVAYDFLRRKRFYDEFSALCESMKREYLITEMIERPVFLEGELAYDALRGATKSMNDEIAKSRRSSEDYRDYIETWVHEVKTPIAAAELAAANDRTPTTERIGVELDRIEKCVDQALYYARGTALQNDYLIRRVDLARLAKDAVRDRSRALIDARIHPTFDNFDFTVLADAKWCRFVLDQIVDNAAKYRKPAVSGDSNKAGLGTAEDQEAAQFQEAGHLDFSACRLGEGSADECVVLSIADNGIGMPAADVARVFERGFTGENGRRYAKSTGMGLYLCKQLCNKMGITISLESTEGAGTCVKLSFPENRMYNP